MTIALEAVYDGEVLRLEKPLDLAPNTRVQIIIEVQELPSEDGDMSFLETAMQMSLEGPSDWSRRLDDYLYGPYTDADDSKNGLS